MLTCNCNQLGLNTDSIKLFVQHYSICLNNIWKGVLSNYYLNNRTFLFKLEVKKTAKLSCLKLIYNFFKRSKDK